MTPNEVDVQNIQLSSRLFCNDHIVAFIDRLSQAILTPEMDADYRIGIMYNALESFYELGVKYGRERAITHIVNLMRRP